MESHLTSFTMRLIFLSNKPYTSAVVDVHSGDLLFQLTTPGLRQRTTTMYDQQGNVVGTWKRRFWNSDEITFRGQTRRLSEWMPKKGWST